MSVLVPFWVSSSSGGIFRESSVETRAIPALTLIKGLNRPSGAGKIRMFPIKLSRLVLYFNGAWVNMYLMVGMSFTLRVCSNSS